MIQTSYTELHKHVHLMCDQNALRYHFDYIAPLALKQEPKELKILVQLVSIVILQT